MKKIGRIKGGKATAKQTRAMRVGGGGGRERLVQEAHRTILPDFPEDDFCLPPLMTILMEMEKQHFLRSVIHFCAIYS